MTDEDIDLIERELNLRLPDSYRSALVPYRIPALSGNTDYLLWDDAQALIRLNREQRKGSRWISAWPHYMYAVGDPHGDEMIAIDTRDPEGPVWWLDHGNLEHEASYLTEARFADWVEEFYRDMRGDLEGDGYDPDAPPAK